LVIFIGSVFLFCLLFWSFKYQPILSADFQ